MKNVKIIKTSDHGHVDDHVYRYNLNLPDYLASWDVYDYWERARLNSMQDKLTKDDVLFDIGAEHGWLSALYAKYMTPHVVLFEPTQQFWPNIYDIFEMNNLGNPIASFQGLVSDKVKIKDKNVGVKNWPLCVKGEGVEKMAYVYLHDKENAPKHSQITIDRFIKEQKIVPNALTIDIEGAELLALKGAKSLLSRVAVKVWVSIHPDLSERDYGLTDNDIHKFMKDLGYKGEHLGTDHEQHWYFSKETK